MESNEVRKLIFQGEVPKGRENDKVWFLTTVSAPVGNIPIPATHTLMKTVRELIDLVPRDDPRFDALNKAADSLLVKEAHNVQPALAFYSLRLNLRYTPKLDAIVDEITPKDFNIKHSFGLPIRGMY